MQRRDLPGGTAWRGRLKRRHVPARSRCRPTLAGHRENGSGRIANLARPSAGSWPPQRLTAANCPDNPIGAAAVDHRRRPAVERRIGRHQHLTPQSNAHVTWRVPAKQARTSSRGIFHVPACTRWWQSRYGSDTFLLLYWSELYSPSRQECFSIRTRRDVRPALHVKAPHCKACLDQQDATTYQP
ncbi:hypothetical protein BH11PSE11_BH11PSE11_22470 [soil metagenome]